MLYMLYQETEKSRWLPALAAERDGIAKTRKPALVSVLNVDNSFDTDLTKEETFALRYDGPFYVDFDAEDIEEATTQFKVFLVNLQAKGVNLDMLRLFATGKKGYHVEVPAQIFMGKVPAVGTLSLPSIYREMAKHLFVDCMDLRVYSSSRGRMWRCPNVKRTDNGQYKVQISAEEALDMDPDTYKQLCSSPRNTLPIEDPALNPDLALIYFQSKDKVSKAVTKIRNKKHVTGQLLKFKGEWPATFEGILAGVTIKPGVGWNLLSMQLAITAAELGRTEEQLLADAEGLLNTHESDSSRYDSPSKRRKDLRDMFRYMSGNPCFEYSPGAIMALLIPEVRANADIALGEFVPDTPLKQPSSTAKGGSPDAESEDTVEDLGDDTSVVRVSRAGIFVRGDEGYRSVCDLGLSGGVKMFGADGNLMGYELEVFLDGRDKGKRFLPMSALTSRGQFTNWSLLLGASMRASDSHTGNLADILRKGSAKEVHAVQREGIDVVSYRGGKGPEVIWASPEVVLSNNKEVCYRYHGLHQEGGTYNSDLMDAPELSLDDAQYIEQLLTINTAPNIAKLLGWFSAAFLTQLIRKQFKRFPILQVFGQAGAGKSMTIILLNHLHYWENEPKQLSASGQTKFPILSALATSASIPVVFEEVKARQMNKASLDFLQTVLRGNYTGDDYARGTIDRTKSQSSLGVATYANAAPITFVGEAIEDQAAILERCVVVALSVADRTGRSKQFSACLADAPRMGRLGKALSMAAMTIDMETLQDIVAGNFQDVSDQIEAAQVDAANRPAFNLAVTLTGLDLLKNTLQGVFGSRFDVKLDHLKHAILSDVTACIPKNMSEVGRVLDTMAQLTRNMDPQYQMVEGRDFTVNEGNTVDIKVRTAYDKYVRYQRSLGMEVLFDTHATFQVALANYGGTTQRACPGSPLFDSVKAVVFKLDLDYLDREGVDSFESIT